MNRIEKFLKKLSCKERKELLFLISLIMKLELQKFDVKKLKGNKNLYRVRKGKLRIVFKKELSQGIIININYRKNIYK